MLMPKRVKRRKQHRGRMKGIATKGNTVTYGTYGLAADDRGWIDSKQIEAARVAMTRSIKRGGKVFIKIFPHKPVSKKPIGVRMGSGKGAPEYWVAVVKPGRVMFEYLYSAINRSTRFRKILSVSIGFIYRIIIIHRCA